MLAAQPRGKEEAEAEKTAVQPGVNDNGNNFLMQSGHQPDCHLTASRQSSVSRLLEGFQLSMFLQNRFTIATR
jgi:hypothetical protein